MEAVSDESSFSRNSREQDEGRYAGGNLLLWIAAIAVLIGLNAASWSFCMWVFGQPEHPMNYKLLSRLDKLDPIRGFRPVTAPRGKFHSAKDLYSQLFPFTETELRAYNGILKRGYLTNYKERDDVTYLSGEFRVESVQKMGEGDVFSSGYVIRGRSVAFPEVMLDLALPSDSAPETFPLGKGEVIQVLESAMCAALLHCARVNETTMIFTAVPLVTREFAADLDPPFLPKEYEFGSGATISLATPPRIQIEPESWPISAEVEAIEEKPVGVDPEKTKEAEEAEQAGKGKAKDPG